VEKKMFNTIKEIFSTWKRGGDIPKNDEKYDRIMFFTDGQFWSDGSKGKADRLWKIYKEMNPKTRKIIKIE
jgi:hypothetical protein